MKIGIVGASGAVGRQMVECLEESALVIDELRLFASEKSRGKEISFRDEKIPLDVVKEDSFEELDYVLGAVSNELSQAYRESIVDAGAIYIDNSSAFRLEEDVPLVVPEINGESALKNHGVIANPNCSTIISMMALAPIHKLSPIESIVASTYQAVSGAGIGGMQELSQQLHAIEEGEEIQTNIFPKQIAFNTIAEIGSYTENGFTTEEMKLQNEGRKILGASDLKVNCTCVRVPVMRSHSISLLIRTKDILDLQTVKDSLRNFEGLQYFEDDVPSPIDVANQDDVFVGRLRKDLIDENGISLWCCGDQIRKGAASNAVGILIYLEKNKVAI